MIIIILSFAITAFGVFLFFREYEVGGVILAGIGALLLLMEFISLPFERMDYLAKGKELIAFKESLKTARENGNANIENAAITLKIAEWNQFLANTKYYNSTIFDIWIPDSVAEQEFIK